MLTAFVVGQQVRPKLDVQGLSKDVIYTVRVIDSRSTAFGTYVTYGVQADAEVIWVVNGHLLLEAVDTRKYDSEVTLAPWYKQRHEPEEWVVWYKGDLLAPTFNSKGAASAYLRLVREGKRSPEYRAA